MRRDESFQVGQHALVEIDLPAGSVLVRAAASGVVTVAIDTSVPESVDVVQLGDDISIRAGRRRRSARIAVDAPVGTDVTVRGASVEVVGRGALGILRVRSASGDVRADDVVGTDVQLSSGDVRLKVVRDSAATSTTSGDVTLGTVGGRWSATSASGDLSADSVTGEVELETTSGDITLGRCDGPTVSLRSVSGDIRLGLPTGIRVEPEISTMSGKVRLPEPAVRSPGEARRPVRLRLRTVSGDIRVERA